MADKEREGSKSEEYHVTFLAPQKGSPTTLKVANADAFAKFTMGSQWKVSWSKAGAFAVLGPAGSSGSQPMPELSLEAEEPKK
jgi:hypothetical protein